MDGVFVVSRNSGPVYRKSFVSGDMGLCVGLCFKRYSVVDHSVIGELAIRFIWSLA